MYGCYFPKGLFIHFMVCGDFLFVCLFGFLVFFVCLLVVVVFFFFSKTSLALLHRGLSQKKYEKLLEQ